MADVEIMRLDDAVFTARPLWLARMIGIAPLLLGLLIFYHASLGNMTVHDDTLSYARAAGPIERILAAVFGFGLAFGGALLSFSQSLITLSASAGEARVKFVVAGIPWSREARSCRKFLRVRITQRTFVTRVFSMISFRVALEGEKEEPLWLGDFMGMELAGGKPFFMSLRSAYEQAHARAEEAATALKLPVSE